MGNMADDPAAVSAVQAAIALSRARWQAQATPLFGLSPADKRLRLGFTPGPGEPSLVEREQAATARLESQPAGVEAEGVPPHVDLRDGGFITPIRDQGRCGSCVAFGTCAAVEGTLRRSANDPALPVNHSEAHLFYCLARAQGRRCGGSNGGWWVAPALEAYQTTGVVDDACYPYVPGDQDCSALCTDHATRVTRITGWRELSDTDEMRGWLSTRGPLVACFTVYDDFFAYRQGIYQHVTGNSLGGHCVCVVGYDQGDGYWICKNSWGTAWGESGFFRIAYGQAGIDATMWAVEGIVDTTWLENQRITGLWTNNQARNGWLYVDGLGWRRIASDSDGATIQLLVLAAAARVANRPVRLQIESSIVKQIYVL
jgi:C1A family cysteine protease